MTTPREQLARLIYTQTSPEITYIETRTQGWDANEVHEYFTADAYRLADAILAAGWQPPPTPPTRPSQTIPYLDN